MHESVRGDADHSRGAGAPRIDLAVDIGFHSETNFFVGFDDDVSEGGLLIATYDLLELGTRIALSFVLPGGALVRVNCHVAFHREVRDADGDLRPAMGVAFEDLDSASAAAIQRYVDVRPPIFHD